MRNLKTRLQLLETKSPPKVKFFVEATDATLDKKLAEYGIKSRPRSFNYWGEDGTKYEVFMHKEDGKSGWMVHPVDVKAEARFNKRYNSPARRKASDDAERDAAH